MEEAQIAFLNALRHPSWSRYVHGDASADSLSPVRRGLDPQGRGPSRPASGAKGGGPAGSRSAVPQPVRRHRAPPCRGRHRGRWRGGRLHRDHRPPLHAQPSWRTAEGPGQRSHGLRASGLVRRLAPAHRPAVAARRDAVGRGQGRALQWRSPDRPSGHRDARQGGRHPRLRTCLSGDAGPQLAPVAQTGPGRPARRARPAGMAGPRLAEEAELAGLARRSGRPACPQRRDRPVARCPGPPAPGL